MNDIEFFVLSMIMHYKQKRGDSSLEEMIESIPRDFSFHLPKSLLYSMIQENLTTRDIISSLDSSANSSEQKSIMKSPLKDISISEEMRKFYDRGYILGDREKESKTIYYDCFADDEFSMHKSQEASSPNELEKDFLPKGDELKNFIANGLEKHFNLKIESIQKERLSKDTKLDIRIDMSERVIEFASPSKKFANYLNGLNDTSVIQKLLDEAFISTQAGSEVFALLDLQQTHLDTNATYSFEYQISDNLCIGRANAIEAIRQNHNQNHNTLFVLLENDLEKSTQEADEQEEYNEIVIPNDFGLECGQWIDKDTLYTLYNVELKMSKQRTKTLQIPVIEAKNDHSKIASVKEQVISYLQNEYKKYRDFSEIITSLRCYIALHALGAKPSDKPLSIALQTHDKAQVELEDIQSKLSELYKSNPSLSRFITHYFEHNIPANKNLKMFLFGKCLEGRDYEARLHTIATHKSQHKGEEAKQLFEKYCQNPPLTKGTLSDNLLATLKDDSLEAIYEWIKPVFIKNMPKQNLADIKRASQYKLLDKSAQDIALSNRTLSQELFRELDKLATNQSIDSTNEFASFTSHNVYKIIDLHAQLASAIHPSDKLKLLQGLSEAHDKLQKECDINHTKEILENLREFSAGIFEHIDYFKKYNAKTIAIWDTSALIDFSKSLESKMRDLYNIVPKSVLKELDGLKNGDDDRAQKVREINRFLAKYSFDKYDDFDYDGFGTDDSLIEIAKDFLSDPLRKSLVKKVWIRSSDNNLCARANGTMPNGANGGQLEKLYAGINDSQVNQPQKKRKKK